MGLATLILVTVVSAGAPAPVPQVLDMPSMAVCKTVMDASIDGIKSVYAGNVMGYYKEVVMAEENGWTVGRNAAQRVIVQAKCQSHSPVASSASGTSGTSGTRAASAAKNTRFAKVAISSVSTQAPAPAISTSGQF